MGPVLQRLAVTVLAASLLDKVSSVLAEHLAVLLPTHQILRSAWARSATLHFQVDGLDVDIDPDSLARIRMRGYTQTIECSFRVVDAGQGLVSAHGPM
jgi:hypothetical protein